MQKIQVEKIELDKSREDTFVKSYAQLAKSLASEDVITIDNLLSVLNKADFIEDTEVMYGNKPASVYYKQFPIVIGDDVMVKIVLLTQADSLALIIPENVSSVYSELKEDPSILKQKNMALSLYVELYNFETSDGELFDLIKSVYLSAGDSLRAFDIPNDIIKKDEEDKEKEKAEQSPSNNFGGEDLFNDDIDSASDFGEIEDDINDFEEIKDNFDQYESFRRVSKNIYNLSKMLYNISDDVIRENVRTKFLNKSKSILVIEVNNKAIYSRLSHVPKLAKRLLTVFGETIRLNGGTQLVDSFTKNNKRYFVISESVGNNFWVVNSDKLDILDKESGFVEPIQDKIIRLNRSSIRKESRKKVPYFKNSRIVYVSKEAKRLLKNSTIYDFSPEDKATYITPMYSELPVIVLRKVTAKDCKKGSYDEYRIKNCSGDLAWYEIINDFYSVSRNEPYIVAGNRLIPRKK